MNVGGSFGELLKRHRKSQDWTQEQLALRAHCSIETIRKIENGRLRPSVSLADSLATVLHIAPDARADFIALARGIAHIHVSSNDQPHNLPVSLNAFTGRDDEVDLLRHHLRDPQRRLITIVGLGGVGKTRLAIESAYALLDEFPDGVWFVSLAPVDSYQFLISAIAEAVSCDLFSAVNPREHLINYFRPKKLLLILDNFEQLLVNENDLFLNVLLAHAPQVKLLVTSRERLNLSTEWLLELNGLKFPLQSNSTGQNYASVEMFRQRALQINPQFELHDNEAMIAEICSRLYGLPLAIEIAVSWLRVMSYRQICDIIVHDQSLLTTTNRDVPHRHRSLYAVFDQSWQLLSDEERRCLRALAVFRSVFDLTVAAAVAEMTPQILRQLIDKSLVRHIGDDSYELHELLRQYLESKLAQEEAVIIRDLHLDYFVHFAESLRPLLEDNRNPTAMQQLERAFPNIRTALEWSLSSPDRALRGVSIIGAMYWYWQLGHVPEGRYWHETLLAIIPAEMVTWEVARALHGASAMAFLQGELDLSKERSERSIAISRQIGDMQGLANSLTGYGFLCSTIGDLETAEAIYDEAEALLDQLDKKYLRVATLSLRCESAMMRGQIQEMEFYIELMRPLFPNDNIWASGFLNLVYGEREMLLGHYEAAPLYLEKAIDHWSATQDKLTVFLAYRRLAESLIHLQQWEKAEQTYHTIREKWQELSNPLGMAATACDLAFVLQRTNRAESAREYLNHALALYHQGQFENGLSCARIAAARLYLEQNDPEYAARLLGAVSYRPREKHFSLLMPSWADWTSTYHQVQAHLGDIRFREVFEHGQQEIGL